MRVLTDEDYDCLEPCAGCEHMYVEDIWNEYQCDEKECPHFLDYAKRQLVDKRKAYDLAADKAENHDVKLALQIKAIAIGEALEILNYKGEYEYEY